MSASHPIRRHPDDGWIIADPYPMSGFTLTALDTLITVICPAEPVPLTEELRARVELHVRTMLRYMQPLVALGFCLAIHALRWSPVWRGVGLCSLAGLPRARAEHVLSEIGESPSPLLRMLVLGARGLILSSYFDQDEVHAAMSYRPLPFLEGRVQLRRKLMTGAAPTAADRIGTLEYPP